jgi:hypothetical protein
MPRHEYGEQTSAHNVGTRAPPPICAKLCRYIVAETADAIYVTFVGTKRLKDLLADLNYWHAPLAATAGATHAGAVHACSCKLRRQRVRVTAWCISHSLGAKPHIVLSSRSACSLPSLPQTSPWRCINRVRARAVGEELRVHKGFQARTFDVPLEPLFNLARARCKSLVFCGARLRWAASVPCHRAASAAPAL